MTHAQGPHVFKDQDECSRMEVAQIYQVPVKGP